MKIHGLQKLTLLDYPGRMACTVFLGGCEYRCPFCHNSELLDVNAPHVMEDDELMEFLKKRWGMLDAVAITGGEPLMRPDLQGFIEQIRSLGYAVKLDTNGDHPDRLEPLLDAHLLDYVAMDIKNCPERYALTCGVERVDLGRIRQSIRLLMEKAPDYEFRTTVVAEFHDTSVFPEIGEMIRGAKKYFLQCFTDRDTVVYGNLHAPSKEELTSYAAIMAPYVESVQLRGV